MLTYTLLKVQNAYKCEKTVSRDIKIIFFPSVNIKLGSRDINPCITGFFNVI